MEKGGYELNTIKKILIEEVKKDISSLEGSVPATEFSRVNIDAIDETDAKMWKEVRSIRTEEDFKRVSKEYSDYRNKMDANRKVFERKKRLIGAIGNYLQTAYYNLQKKRL